MEVIFILLNSEIVFRHLVIGKMEEMFGVSFQDISELNQATQFLHENGNNLKIVKTSKSS